MCETYTVIMWMCAREVLKNVVRMKCCIMCTISNMLYVNPYSVLDMLEEAYRKRNVEKHQKVHKKLRFGIVFSISLRVTVKKNILTFTSNRIS